MNPEVKAKFSTYPDEARRQLEAVRQLILAVAREKELGSVEETLKWGEASYLVKGGTPIRMDWKPKDPNAIKVYFHCQTKLIETIKEVYRDAFKYEGNRAMIIPLDAPLKEGILGHCLQMALQYHSLKHLPLLGA